MIRTATRSDSKLQEINLGYKLGVFTSVFALTVMGLLGCTSSKGDSPRPPMVSSLTIQKSAVTDGNSEAAQRLAGLKALHFAPAAPDAPTLNVPTAVSSAAPQPATPAIDAKVTFLKSEILGRDFLYSVDLQYSSIGDTQHSLLMQSLIVGTFPARINIVGDQLEIVADQSRLFESDANHPGRLLNSFPIVRQDANSVTVLINQASPTLTTASSANQAAVAHSNWVRSVEFASQGNYLLMETSIEQADGTIAEFMESLYPRDSVVPKDAKPIVASHELNANAKRFRMISGEEIFVDLPKGRTRTPLVSHFNVTATSGVIEWYVTPNVPAKYLPVLKNAVEGWNRYSQKMWHRDFIKFNGVLPAGVKLGDPRYNVINWDSVPAAGAAYESQSVDPLTGIQTHSLIYLPYAWVKIGEDYWKGGANANNDGPTSTTLSAVFQNTSFLGHSIQPNCINNMEFAASLSARKSPEVFATELLKGTLFHEVGHALGLDHNFKGSLAWNPEDPKSQFTTSIMDYNQYELETSAFNSPDSADGPLLEYDRQILSVIYNDGKDVAKTDPVLPACNDREADDMSAGVDPTCVRYDIGNDPSESLVSTIGLTIDPKAKFGTLKSLPAAIDSVSLELKDPATIKTEVDAKAEITRIADLVGGIAKYYYASGPQSVRYAMTVGLKSLYEFRAGVVLPGGEKADKSAYLGRIVAGLNYVVGLEGLEPATKAALDKLTTQAASWIQATPWFAGVSSDEKGKKGGALLMPIAMMSKMLDATLLPPTRAKILASLVRNENTPFYFSATNAPVVDIEKLVLDLLEEALTQPLGKSLRPPGERAAAAFALQSFNGTLEGKAAIARANATLDLELAHAKSSAERTALRKIVAILNTPAASAVVSK